MPTTLTRSLLSVLVPGVIALAPWILLWVLSTEIAARLEGFAPLAYAVLFGFAAVTGSIFEGLGTVFEARWDRERDESFQVRENWYKYLSRTFDNEPIWYRYINRLVTHLYFELSMMLASVVFVAGVAAISVVKLSEHSYLIYPGAIASAIALASYFYWQARSSHLLLCKVRKELNERIDADTRTAELHT